MNATRTRRPRLSPVTPTAPLLPALLLPALLPKALVLAALLVPWTTGCSDNDAGDGDAMPDAAARADTPAAGDAADDEDAAAGEDAGAPTGPTCDPIDPAHCLLPYPSAHFLAADKTSPTGYRLDLSADLMPKNADGKHIDPAAWNRSDGFGVGWAALAMFPGVDLAELPTENKPDGCLAADAPIVLLEVKADGGVQRVPYFAELDADIDIKEDAQRLLIVRPLVIPKEATRYVIAFRGLVDKQGKAFAPSEAFAALRDGNATGPLAARQGRFDEVFALLGKACVKRGSVQLAWDWVTSSHEFLHGDILHMRDEAMKLVGDQGPELKITALKSFTKAENPRVAFEIRGTFRVPHYMKQVPLGEFDTKAWRLNRGADGKPAQNGWRDADFWVRIPHTAIGGPPHGLLQYGHGLLGTGGQVGASHLDRILRERHYISYSGNWLGMSNDDVKYIMQMIFDFTDFPIIPERTHQGMVQKLLLARAVRERLVELPELKGKGIKVDKERQHYTGDSQGGIYGATYVALSQEITRAVLGVPGQNYSILLARSVDFVPYFTIMRARYPSPVDRTVMLSAGQLLWDQVDPVSYYRHMAQEPFKDTPAHRVILGSAKGDYQVALLTNEITARSKLGVALMKGYGRPLWGIEAVAYPHDGSALVNWDYGNPWPPAGAFPPQDDHGDPHGKPRKDPRYIEQMLHFFKTGVVKDVCGGKPCTKL